MKTRKKDKKDEKRRKSNDHPGTKQRTITKKKNFKGRKSKTNEKVK